MAATSPQQGFPWVQRYRPWLIGALISGAAVVGWSMTRPKPAPSPKAPLVQQVTALGRLTPSGGLVKLAVPAGTAGGNEVVDRWFVNEGDPISKGQLLTRLSSYGQLKAMLDQAESNLVSTQALLPFLKISKSRGSQLYADGAISEEELAKTSASIITKQADIVGAQAAVVKARQQLNAAEIRSPLDGNLIRVYSWPGMKETDQGLALIGRTERMQVWAQVFQSDVPKLRIGQGATVRAESGGFTGNLRAQLESIIGVVSDRDLFATNANNDVNARVVLVKLNLDPADRQRVARLSSLNVTVRFDP